MQVFDRTRHHQGGFTTHRPHTRYLVVHHAAALYRTATGDEDVASIARYHLSKGWSGIGYHEVLAEVTNGGPIAAYVVSNPDLQRAHVALRNDECWGICCATNFGAQLPEGKWIDALAERLATAKRRYPNAQIVGHQEIARPGYTTSCPGTRWKEWKPRLLRQVEALLAAPTPTPTLPTPGTYTEVSGLAGRAPITDAQAAAVVIRRGSPYSAYSVQEIAAHVWHYAELAELNALLVWAQILHETDYLRSWWAQRPRRNSAGIGVTGRYVTTRPPTIARVVDGDLIGVWARQGSEWVEGVSFPTWEHSIRAQIGRLLLYTIGGGMTKAQQNLAAYANAVRRLPPHGWSSVATLKALGRVHNPANIGRPDNDHVGWAWPGTEYGMRIAEKANAILREI